MHHDLVTTIQQRFKANADKEIARQQEGYLKNHFSFHGIMTTPRRALIQDLHANFKYFSPLEMQQVFSSLWTLPEREYHHAAMDLMSKQVKKTDIAWLPFWEEKITQNSWWDSVDYIAPSLIGPLLVNDHTLQRQHTEKWLESSHLWLQRTAIIFQLKYKTKTNFTLLCDTILAMADSKEFFIRKASGWALREYGKTNAHAVSTFVNEYRDILSNLTVKEAERRLYK
jgi:3-methyladenine DNA glycosylase AlkD